MYLNVNSNIFDKQFKHLMKYFKFHNDTFFCQML